MSQIKKEFAKYFQFLRESGKWVYEMVRDEPNTVVVKQGIALANLANLEDAINRSEPHFMIEKLDELLKGNNASWAREWIDCLAYMCSCPKCLARLKQNEIVMLDKIFKE